jgi:hypothetical protein
VANVLTVANNGTLAAVTVGQQLTVDLRPAAGVYAWDRPRLAGAALRLVSAVGGYPSRLPMQAVFLAVAPGVAVVLTASDIPCLHARPPCLLAQRLWQAQVIVRSSG